MSQVLVIEDSRTQAEAVRSTLQSAGFEVGVAFSGEEALTLLERTTFDLVVSDVLMPGISGYEVCRKVKPRGIPVLLLTTLRDPMDLLLGFECGADGFLVKPCEPDHLVDRVRNLLDRTTTIEGELQTGAEIVFRGRRLRVASDNAQIFGMLLSAFEETVRTNQELMKRERELAEAQARLDAYARGLEGQVRASDDRYRTLMKHAVDGIFVLDAHGTILEHNVRAEELLNAAPGSLVGTSLDSFIRGTPDDRERLRAVWAKEGAKLERASLETATGRPLVAEISSSSVQVGDGIRTLAIVRDVGERLRREQRERHNERLVLMGSMSAGIAHEINNPTAYVRSNLNYVKEVTRQLREDFRRGSGTGGIGVEIAELEERLGELEEVVEESRRGLDHIAEIGRALTTLARKDSDHPTPVDVNATLQWCLRVTAAEFKSTAGVDTRFDEGLPRVLGFSGRLGQVFINLLMNAIQAFDRPDTAKNRIEISTRPDGRFVEIEIRDNGRGISDGDLARAFDPFFTTKAPDVGTGLGLPICDEIVRQHGGTLTLTSREGAGTTCVVRLPAS